MHSRCRSLLIEGPVPTNALDVNPHSLLGALVSIAAIWRLPVLQSTDACESYRLLRFLADQGRQSCQTVLVRYERKPKRLATHRLFVLQGLPESDPLWRPGSWFNWARSNAS